MNKKGALTDAQIITVVLAILGFMIVAGFIYYLNFGQQSSQDICHLSVITRATAPSSIQGALQLKCTTGKICITDGSGKCEDSFAGEKDVDIVSLKGSDTEKVSLIEEITANAMYDCWNMMGQGKVDIFGSYYKSRNLEIAKSTCVICSRLALDKSVSNNVADLINVRDYMAKTQVPGSSLTYLQTFTDKQVSAYPRVDKYVFEESSPITLGDNARREIAFVFMQIKTTFFSDSLKSLTQDGAILLTGGAFVGSKIPGSGFLFKGGVLRFAAVYGGAVAAGGIINSAIKTWGSQELAAGYCGAFETNDEKNKMGCSIVEATPYSVGNINSLCEQIDGNP